jgi:hypothetical protein
MNDAGFQVLCPTCQVAYFVNERGSYFLCADGWHVCSVSCKQKHDAEFFRKSKIRRGALPLGFDGSSQDIESADAKQ